MKTKSDFDLPDFVQPVLARGRWYFYFRRGKVRIKLPGQPGSHEFQNAYDAALRAHGPQPEVTPLPQLASGAGRGSVAWVIEQYKKKSEQWANASRLDAGDL